jgi:CheY-like chemotaxis protein
MRKLNGVLLIDDNETSNFLNQRLLNRMSIAEQIRVFTNGKQAIEYLQQLEQDNNQAPDSGSFMPDLILLDINMPVLDGFEFLEMYEELSDELKQKVVIAILSTSSHQQDTARASEFNAYYILKPLTTEKLTDLMNENFA